MVKGREAGRWGAGIREASLDRDKESEGSGSLQGLFRWQEFPLQRILGCADGLELASSPCWACAW